MNPIDKPLPPLPAPNVTYADHSYPAFNARAMTAYAEAAILADRASRPDPAGVVREVASREGERLSPDREAVELVDFQDWWHTHGEYLRAGGGDYEQCFAWGAWLHRAAAQAAVERDPSAIQAAAHAVILARDNLGWSPEVDAKIEDLRRVLAGEPSGDALDARRYRQIREGAQCDSKHGNGLTLEAGGRLKAVFAFRYWCTPEELDGKLDAFASADDSITAARQELK